MAPKLFKKALINSLEVVRPLNPPTVRALYPGASISSRPRPARTRVELKVAMGEIISPGGTGGGAPQ